MKAINNEETRLIGMKPVDAIKKKEVVAKPSAPTKNANEERVASGVDVRYLY